MVAVLGGKVPSIITRRANLHTEILAARTRKALGQPTIGEVSQELCVQSSDEQYKMTFHRFRFSAPNTSPNNRP